MGRYNNITIESSKTGKKYRIPPIYPEIKPADDDIYVISTEGDRFDLLAWEFYQNVEYWWIIAVANPEVSADSLAIAPGYQLRIPMHPDVINAEYIELNQ